MRQYFALPSGALPGLRSTFGEGGAEEGMNIGFHGGIEHIVAGEAVIRQRRLLAQEYRKVVSCNWFRDGLGIYRQNLHN